MLSPPCPEDFEVGFAVAHAPADHEGVGAVVDGPRRRDTAVFGYEPVEFFLYVWRRSHCGYIYIVQGINV